MITRTVFSNKPVYTQSAIFLTLILSCFYYGSKLINHQACKPIGHTGLSWWLYFAKGCTAAHKESCQNACYTTKSPLSFGGANFMTFSDLVQRCEFYRRVSMLMSRYAQLRARPNARLMRNCSRTHAVERMLHVARSLLLFTLTFIPHSHANNNVFKRRTETAQSTIYFSIPAAINQRCAKVAQDK